MPFHTFTFVVRMSEDDIRDVQQGIDDDPRKYLTDDEVMFWGEESGISPTAMKLGADPDSWPDADLDDDVRGCSCGMADYGAPGHDGDDTVVDVEEI